MSKVKIHIRAQEYHSPKGGKYRAGSAQMVEPAEAEELVKAGIAVYAHPLGQVQTAMADGPAPMTRAERTSMQMADDRTARAAAEERAEKAEAELAEERAAKAKLEAELAEAREALVVSTAPIPGASGDASGSPVEQPAAEVAAEPAASEKKKGNGKAPKEG